MPPLLELSGIRRLRTSLLKPYWEEHAVLSQWLYEPGDPDTFPATSNSEKRPKSLPDALDVLIVGSGPAGMVLAAQLSTFPSICTRLIERRSGPLQVGQADGVTCRTVEMFEAFGLERETRPRSSYWVNETVFWRPFRRRIARKIMRTGRVQDTEDGLSEFPHLIVNQARLLRVSSGSDAQKSPTRLVPDFNQDFVTLKVEYARRLSGCKSQIRNLETGRRGEDDPAEPSTLSAATVRAVSCACARRASRTATPPTTPGASSMYSR